MNRFLLNGLRGREPLLIEPSRAQDHAALADKVGFTDLISKLFGDRPKAYLIDDGEKRIGVVPVHGVIGKSLAPVEKLTGAVDVDDISNDIDAMLEAGADRIAFDVSSPGGTVTGVEELANKIRALGVPTMAYTDTEMASAAYWIASAADRVLVSPSASVGSIGCYLVVYDMSKAFEAAGVQARVYKAGRYKAIGVEGAEITPDQDEYLQDSVEEIWEDFKFGVKMKRLLVKPEDMEAQVYSGKVAAAKGLATGVADSFKAALASF